MKELMKEAKELTGTGTDDVDLVSECRGSEICIKDYDDETIALH